MSTIDELIAAAFRTDNLIAVGTSPTTAQGVEALARLNALVTFQYDKLINGLVQDWPVPSPSRTAPVASNYPFEPGANDLTTAQQPYPPVNARLVSKVAVATTIYLPYEPNDGAQMTYVDLGNSAIVTLSGNGRKIEAATSVALAVSGTSPKRWFYRADLGEWKLVATLAGSDASPFPASVDDFLILSLYKRLCAGFGKVPSDQANMNFNEAEEGFKRRYRQPTPNVGSGELPESEQSYRPGVADNDWMT